MISDYILSLKNEIGFYYNVIKFLVYFSVGALFLIILNKLFEIIRYFFSKFSKDRFIGNIKFIIKILIFICISIFIGWIIIHFII